MNALLQINLRLPPKESVIEFLAVAVALGTIVMLWKHRKSPEVKYLIFIEIFAALWALTSGFEFLSPELAGKKFWAQTSYLGFAFLPLFYFLFTTAFSQKLHLITPSNLALLSILPFAVVPLVFTNDSHHLIWRNVSVDASTNMLIVDHGIGFWIFWSYSITLIFAGIYNLVRTIYDFTAYYRSQVSTLLIATVIPLVANLIYVSDINPIPGFDWTPVSFVFTGLVIGFGVIRYRMFDLVPFARNRLIDTMSDGVIVVNSEGFIEDCNPAVSRIFNLGNSSIIRKRFAAVFFEFPQLGKALTDGNEKLIEIEITHSGNKNFYQARISPVYDREQKFSGQLLQINEITSLKNTESQLKEEIEERGRLIEDLDAFAHTVAHDLRNSLGSVFSSSEIIVESLKEGNTEISEEFAVMIKQAAGKAMQITQELLILATVNHHEIEKKPLNMEKIFLAAKSQIEDLIVQTRASISMPEKWPGVLGYANWIEEVWVNFLTNAIKYGGSPPEIHIGSSHNSDGTVRFWIKDNGDGISPADQSLLFQKYVRLVPEKADGYGLGLSIVKHIIDKLDGKIGVESSGEKGEGSLFWFELPLN